MKLLSERESGQAFILVLVLLLIGGLMLPPLLALVNTGLKSSQLYEQKTDELFAADTGVEDALWKIINDPSLDALACGEPYPYPLSQQVNGLLVNVEVTKVPVIEGLLSGDEYGHGPHEDWWYLILAPEQVSRDYDEGWVEYYCDMTFTYTGVGNRELATIGAFFAPFPGHMNLIEGPYDIVYTPVITGGLPETKIASGGFAFIWRWEDGPIFNTDTGAVTGAVSFKFKIHDPDWSYSNCFLWATLRQQDGYGTNAPGYKWLIEATAGDTTVRSVVIEDLGALSILTWEID